MIMLGRPPSEVSLLFQKNHSSHMLCVKSVLQSTDVLFYRYSEIQGNHNITYQSMRLVYAESQKSDWEFGRKKLHQLFCEYSYSINHMLNSICLEISASALLVQCAGVHMVEEL